jgi:hypothetical protein
MSIERELLQTALGILEDYEWGYGGDHHKSPEASILNDIRKLLAQPEQEPVAWMSLSDIEWMNIVNHPKILELTDGRHNSEEAVNLAVKMTEEKCKKNNSDSIPKRPPLTPQQISVGNQSMLNVTREAFVKGVKFAEKMHGIGGKE